MLAWGILKFKLNNGNLPRHNSVGKRDRPGTVPGIPLKRVMV
jgi:hypothetical protein